ncbi:AMP-binding protein, partial [Staphylococcus aureus]|uniref:AMP-binding protein n=1 Tax=Staphylococcus aureus TaxID=1280 RepID=UPI0012B00359
MASPDVPQLLHHFFAQAAAQYPDKIAVRLANPSDELEVELSYAEVWSRAHQFADVLRERGIGPG